MSFCVSKKGNLMLIYLFYFILWWVSGIITIFVWRRSVSKIDTKIGDLDEIFVVSIIFGPLVIFMILIGVLLDWIYKNGDKTIIKSK